MQNILAVTAPVYLLIALGFCAVRFGAMAQPDMRVLGRFVAQFCIPALLFRALSQNPIAAVLRADYLFVYAAGSLLALAIVLFVALKVRKRPMPLAALLALGGAASNSVFVGYPIAQQLIGAKAGIALALCSLIENVVIMPLTLALASSAEGGSGRREMLRATFAAMLRNPILMAIVVGLVASALRLPLPSVVDRSVALVAAAAPPTALFVIGGSLVGLKLEGMRGDIALAAGAKLLLHPLCVFAFLWLWPPQEPALRAAALLFAAMPMMSIYPLLAQRHGHERLCAAALLAATVASFFTISALILLLPAEWVAAR